MAKSISIRVATKSDYEDLIGCLREFYYTEEPITISHPQPGHTKDDEAFTMSFFDSESMLIATDDETGTVVGALSAGPIEPGDADAMIEEAKTTETKKWREIMLLLAYIEKKADVLNRMQIPKALHIHALGVHKAYRGQRIGEKLFRFCFENAKRLNYPMVTTDCTSIYSIALAERCGMERVSRVTYEEYNKSINEELYQPKEPNLEIITFVKKEL
jgi:ribosomal protein S18 acetylase RimI-like enzyme